MNPAGKLNDAVAGIFGACAYAYCVSSATAARNLRLKRLPHAPIFGTLCVP